MPERLNGPPWKGGVSERAPRVRIPLFPHEIFCIGRPKSLIFRAFVLLKNGENRIGGRDSNFLYKCYYLCMIFQSRYKKLKSSVVAIISKISSSSDFPDIIGTGFLSLPLFFTHI